MYTNETTRLRYNFDQLKNKNVKSDKHLLPKKKKRAVQAQFEQVIDDTALKREASIAVTTERMTDETREPLRDTALKSLETEIRVKKTISNRPLSSKPGGRRLAEELTGVE